MIFSHEAYRCQYVMGTLGRHNLDVIFQHLHEPVRYSQQQSAAELGAPPMPTAMACRHCNFPPTHETACDFFPNIQYGRKGMLSALPFDMRSTGTRMSQNQVHQPMLHTQQSAASRATSNGWTAQDNLTDFLNINWCGFKARADRNVTTKHFEPHT